MPSPSSRGLPDRSSICPPCCGSASRRENVLPSVALIAVLVGVEALDERRPLWERLAARPLYVRWGVYYALLICLIVFGMWELQQFVYRQFLEVDHL